MVLVATITPEGDGKGTASNSSQRRHWLTHEGTPVLSSLSLG